MLGKNIKTCILISVIIIIVILLVWNKTNQRTMNEFIQGMWIAPDEFCNQSDIGGMIIYINNNKGYLVIHDNNAVLASGVFKLNYTARNCLNPSNIKGTVAVEKEEIDIDEIWPKNMNLEINMGTGCMIWQTDKVWVKCYKQHLEQ